MGQQATDKLAGPVAETIGSSSQGLCGYVARFGVFIKFGVPSRARFGPTGHRFRRATILFMSCDSETKVSVDEEEPERLDEDN
jgi:hypothetical protein